MMPIFLEAVAWRHLSDDGLGSVEVELTINRDDFDAMLELLRGVAIDRRGAGVVEISQAVLLRIVRRDLLP
jgi:hypothetical protein